MPTARVELARIWPSDVRVQQMLLRPRSKMTSLPSPAALAVATLCLGALLTPRPLDAQRSATDSSVVRLQVSGESKETLATAVLVHREVREHDIVLYLLTSAQVPRASGSHRPDLSTVSSHDFPTEHVVLSAKALDIAVLKIVTRDSVLVPARVSLDSPHPGDRFVVAVNDGESVASVALRARMVSTRFVITDQDLSSLPGCLGAPAFRDDAVFGVVTECLSGRAAVIALLGGVESFLRRQVPGLSVGK
jgi:hypothetical protein